MTLKISCPRIDKTKINKIIYISTSGVYGDRKDQLVNENQINALTDRAKRRVDAEYQIIKSELSIQFLEFPAYMAQGRLPLKRVDR
jgi:UDP-glucose 4-epimerase